MVFPLLFLLLDVSNIFLHVSFHPEVFFVKKINPYAQIGWTKNGILNPLHCMYLSKIDFAFRNLEEPNCSQKWFENKQTFIPFRNLANYHTCVCLDLLVQK